MSVWVAWSGGKDAALALAAVERSGRQVDGLLTTTAEATRRSSMHGIRRALLEAQAAAVGVPLKVVPVPGDGTHESYTTVVREALAELDCATVVFGDILLEDVRAFREKMLAPTTVDGEWPLWGADTAELTETLATTAYDAVVTTVDGSELSPWALGATVGEAFAERLPNGADPCGERGEFHTFVRDAPVFAHPVGVRFGRRLTRELEGTPYHYLDLIPTGPGRAK